MPSDSDCSEATMPAVVCSSPGAAPDHRTTLTKTPFLATDRLRLATDPALPIDVDGELHLQTPASIRIEPEALRIMMPNTPSTPDHDQQSTRPAGATSWLGNANLRLLVRQLLPVVHESRIQPLPNG